MHAEGFGSWVSGFGCVGNFVGDFEGRVRGCMAGSGVVFRLSDYAGSKAMQTSFSGIAVSVQLAFRASLDLSIFGFM